MAIDYNKGKFVFDRLLANGVRSGQIPARTQNARSWYRSKAAKVRDTRKRFLEQARTEKRHKAKFQIGRMYFFVYENPKYKDDLPYWDAFPLIFPFDADDKHIYAINLHHAPPKIRAIIMDNLYSIASDDKYNQRTKLEISYRILKGLAKSKYIKPLVRSYLINRVGSKFIEVQASEWDIALFLPYQSFRKQGAQKVYNDYRKKVAKG